MSSYLEEERPSVCSVQIVSCSYGETNMQEIEVHLIRQRRRVLWSFDEYFREHGIQHQKTPPKTLQLHGLAEMMNMTLVERVKCLLSQSQLPRSLWGEALGTEAHVLNITSCIPIGFEVADRIWSEKAFSYEHLHVFGCKAFVNIMKDERSKLDAKT